MQTTVQNMSPPWPALVLCAVALLALTVEFSHGSTVLVCGSDCKYRFGDVLKRRRLLFLRKQARPAGSRRCCLRSILSPPLPPAQPTTRPTVAPCFAACWTTLLSTTNCSRRSPFSPVLFFFFFRARSNQIGPDQASGCGAPICALIQRFPSSLSSHRKSQPISRWWPASNLSS